MSDIVLFHSVLGLRAGVLDAADRLRAAGHTVHTPDYYDGRTYDEYPPAFEFLDEIGGIPDVIARCTAVAGRCWPIWCTPGSRSAACRPNCWPRPGPARGA